MFIDSHSSVYSVRYEWTYQIPNKHYLCFVIEKYFKCNQALNGLSDWFECLAKIAEIEKKWCVSSFVTING